MPRLFLVRHGTATAGWADDVDPGLSDAGRDEAEGAARCLGALGPLALVSSPLRRAMETAVPFERRWGVSMVIEPRVGEIPPPDVSLEKRRNWLLELLAGTWTLAPAELVAWRGELLDALRALTEDTVVVSHFVAINAVIGAATGDDRMVCRRLANASVTTVDAGADGFAVVDLGAEAAQTVVRPGLVQP